MWQVPRSGLHTQLPVLTEVMSQAQGQQAQCGHLGMVFLVPGAYVFGGIFSLRRQTPGVKSAACKNTGKNKKGKGLGNVPDAPGIFVGAKLLTQIEIGIA